MKINPKRGEIWCPSKPPNNADDAFYFQKVGIVRLIISYKNRRSLDGNMGENLSMPRWEDATWIQVA